ncbi:MAG TPA: TIGR03943 family protein [Kineosporiaceae bacterium]|nr:TIGR03943 family protein [Kineosporiaceae bacterium]
MDAVTPLVGGTTLLLVGAMLIRLTVTDAYQRYVRVGMGSWLLVAGVLLAILGSVAVVTALRGTKDEDHPGEEDHHSGEEEHDHEHGDRVGWLLLVPVLALLLVVPPALGSFGVDRSQVRAAPGTSAVFDPLPAAAEPRPMTLLEFDQRAFDRSGQSMQGIKLVLTGFVAKSADGNGFRIARYQIACCAADAVAAVARVSGATGAAPTRDAWFIVTGTFKGIGADGVPEFVASTVQQTPAPVDPYE